MGPLTVARLPQRQGQVDRASIRGVEGKNSGVGTDTSEDLLNGARVLVVEDEAAISMLLEDMLLDFGCEVVGPAARLSKALEMAESESFVVAILDVNVAGEPIYPVAEAIVRRGLPLVFSTGYGGAGIREPFRDRPVVQKPFSQQDLKRTLIAAIAAGG
jgi:CheY-like chemotaxis protein